MKLEKLLLVALVASALTIPCQMGQKSQAVELTSQNVGFIDVNYIVNNSKETQALKQKQDALTVELQKYGITEKEKMMNAKSSLNKQDMEKELIKKVSVKKDDLEKQYRDNFIAVQQKIKTAVNSVEKKKHIDLVFTKDSLVSGGVDITKDVMEILDSSK
jgi:Skp family chaperone for outer membrane proteins